MSARFALALAALLALTPRPADAQVCWWRTSLARCKLLVLTETSLAYPLVNPRTHKLLPGMTPADSTPYPIRPFHSELGWELGMLYVLDARTALGASAQRTAAFDRGEGALRLTLRGRRQLTRSLSVEANVGTIEGHAGNSGDRFYPAQRKVGPTVQLRANVEDLLMLGVRYDQLPWRDNGPEQRDRYPTGTAHGLSAVLTGGVKPSIPFNVVLLAGLIVIGIGLGGAG